MQLVGCLARSAGCGSAGSAAAGAGGARGCACSLGAEMTRAREQAALSQGE